jgi:uncharacterized RDD family membrane protein YckC
VALLIIGTFVLASYEQFASTAARFFTQTIGAITLVFVPFCLYWGYFAAFEIWWQGRTPGKHLAGIRVIHQSGRPANAVESIGRNLLRGVDVLPGFYAVGLITMMCNAQNRRLGDFVAGTIVVHDKGMETVAPSWGEPQSSEPLPPELRKLTPDDLVLIETYLNRRYEIDPVVRQTTATRIVGLIGEKTGFGKPTDQRDDDFLESIARQMRDGAAFR